MNAIYARLAEKYTNDLLFYTEYPHKSCWRQKKDDKDFRVGLKNLFSVDENVPLMLYLHIPYCRQQCFYCTCYTMIASDYELVKNYLTLLFKEIDLLRAFFKEYSIVPNFTEVHIGGGSPDFLRKEEFDQLIDKIGTIANIGDLSEFSIEVDPRQATLKLLEYYHAKGIDRLSFGIQDFDPDVQKAINRIQPAEMVEKLLIPKIREYFPKGVNFDILCGLPLQTVESIRRTFETIIKLSPDRICFNYLHYAPKFAKHQMLMIDGKNGRPTRLPDLYERKMIFTQALDLLLAHGYVRTGYEHFAKPGDEIVEAMRNKKMFWNSLGVTSGRYSDMIGLGPHSWSTMGNYYSQNVFELSLYEKALSAGQFPVFRDYVLNDDDIIRRDVIKGLRNFFFIDFADIGKKYNIDFKKYFNKEIVALTELVDDRIISISAGSITVTDLGQQFVNAVCMKFDSHLRNKV